MRAIRWVGALLVLLAAIVAIAWAFGAVWFDAPFGDGNKVAAALLAITFVVVLVFVRPFWRKIVVVVVLFAGVLTCWLTLSPTNDSDWQPDVAQEAWADIQGDEVTFHNVRNCDYRTETDYTPRWETRTVRISQITGIDLAINYWGSPWIAHPIVSFQFADAPPLCFSIEIRKKLGQAYSTIGGLYRQFELIYIVADERDVIRLRTNYRKEDVYLYRTTVSPAQARERFLEYVQSLNSLRNTPRWYNAITTNCTTSIRAQHPRNERVPWDWRILLNGKGDELMYERGVIVTGGLPFTELKARSLIDTRASAANASPDFSQLIREGLPFAPRSVQRGNIAAQIIEEFSSTSCGTRASVTRDLLYSAITASLAAKAGTATEFEDSLLSCRRYVHSAPGARFAVDRAVQWSSSSPPPCVRSLKQTLVPQRAARIYADYDEKR